ncbi:MAG: hypothetical protein NC489_08305 [Ruminococcus flavefaciens]|nr:hypothetical protein [Ruminococcus flavefaciens]
MSKAKKSKKDSVEYDIEKIHLFLNKEQSKVFVRVSWNGRPAKDEVRSCWMKDGELKLGKGIALSPADITSLYDFLDTVGVDFEPPAEDEPEGVDFDEIFRSSEGIMEKREQGYRTENGFIRLTRRDRKLGGV